ncbi:type II toxin-antitoxin system RelE/ParE family toxin [Streptomyces sp. NBC_00487]|uniref:hypothetical protein n=1 Tax=unclassified Streptomyces TaxID=2593676 RepID=UPI002E17D9E3|nr:MULTISPECIES: hypothetical protein [unclassified Streptomyces]
MTWGGVELEPEAEQWLPGLSAGHRGTVAFYVDLLAVRGPLLTEPYSRELDGKLRERRFHLDSTRSASPTGSPPGAGSSC